MAYEGEEFGRACMFTKNTNSINGILFSAYKASPCNLGQALINKVHEIVWPKQ